MATFGQNVNFQSPAYDYGPEQAEIERRRALAQALGQQSMQANPTQVVGGWAVKQSPFEHLAKLGQAYLGTQTQKKADEQQKALSGKVQDDYRQMVATGLRQLQGSPGSPQPSEELGGGPAQPAQEPDPAAALATFGGHPMGAPMMPLAMQQIQQQQRKQMLADILRGGAAPQQGNPMAAWGASDMAPGGGAPQGGFSAGIPPQIIALMTSGDPELVKLGQSLLEANKGIAQRPGAPVVNPFTGAVIAQPTPSVPAGVGLQVGPGGPQAYPVPGAQGAMAGITASQAGAQEAGKAPFQVDTYQTPGAPTVLTRQQAIERATGRPMPNPAAPQQPQSAPVQIPQGPAPQGGGGFRLQDQGQGAEQQGMGRQLAEYSGRVQESAASAAVSNRYLDNMEMAARDIRLGKLAPAQSSLIQWAQAAGLPVGDEDKKAAGSIQALSSMAIKMAGQATRQSDAQPSQLQYFKILESMPNAERTEDGFNKIVSYLRDSNNYAIAKQQYLQQWRQQHGSADGFEAQWPKQAQQLPFVWNQKRRTDDLKGITSSKPSPQDRIDAEMLVNKWLR